LLKLRIGVGSLIRYRRAPKGHTKVHQEMDKTVEACASSPMTGRTGSSPSKPVGESPELGVLYRQERHTIGRTLARHEGRSAGFPGWG
jgi:hypothetical protein